LKKAGERQRFPRRMGAGHSHFSLSFEIHTRTHGWEAVAFSRTCRKRRGGTPQWKLQFFRMPLVQKSGGNWEKCKILPRGPLILFFFVVFRVTVCSPNAARNSFIALMIVSMSSARLTIEQKLFVVKRPTSWSTKFKAFNGICWWDSLVFFFVFCLFFSAPPFYNENASVLLL